MAFTWKLDPSRYDISIDNKGKIPIVNSVDEVQQRILVTLWHYWGEYFLNVPAGVPWYELILGSKDTKMVEALLRYVILQVPGVVSIIRFEIVRQDYTRDYAIYATVEVNGGVINILQPINESTLQYLASTQGIQLTDQDGTYLGVAIK